MPLLILSFLSRNNYNTIRTTTSVDSCSRSIFEYVHTRHVIHVNHVQRHIGRYTVNHNQRLGVIDTTDTTDVEAHIATRSTGTDNLQTGCTTFQSHTNRRCGNFLKIFLCYLRDSTRQVAFLLDSVTDHHHFFEHFSILFKDNFHVGSCGKRLRCIADVTDFQCSTFGDIQREITIKVGDGSIGRTLLQYTGSDDGFAFFVHNHSTHLRPEREDTSE